MNPYLVLNVPETADDKAVRAAYLNAIKHSPPETAPERFQQAAAAYEKIKDERRRLQHLLFDETQAGDTPLDAIRRTLAAMPASKPPAFDAMKEFLRHCSKP